MTSILGSILASDVPDGARVLLAVSGGADSVALFRGVLGVVRDHARHWELGVAHVNHGLRAQASDEDEAFVRSLAEREGVPFWSVTIDTASHARAHHLSIEAAARELRYEALFDLMRRWEGDVLMTGHTLDDQAETVLLRLLRGSGIRGLGGMRDRSGALVRPFLGIRRDQVIAYLQAEGQGYRVDSSNFDTHHLRNRLRRDIMPSLDLLQPRLALVLARTARLLQSDADFLYEQATAALSSMDAQARDGRADASLPVWQSLHPALRHATLILLIDRLLGRTAGVTAEQIDALAAALEGSTERVQTPLPGGFTVSRRADRFILRIGKEPVPPPLQQESLCVPGTTRTEAGTLDAELVELDASEREHRLAVCGPFHALCDADAIAHDFQVGAKRAGDRMRPIGSPGSRKLQDIFVDRKLPVELRDRVAVIRDADGIVWIPGIALDQRVALRPETTRILHCRWQPAPGV